MRFLRLFITIAALASLSAPALANPRVLIHGIRQDPSDQAGKDYSRPGWGLGAQISYPLPGSGGMLAVTGGFDAVNLLSATKKFQDQP